MYPVPQGLSAAFILEAALFLLTVLRYGEEMAAKGISVSACEVTGFVTAFFFLMFMRVADDFKDTETDKRLFPARPYPSGRIKKRDLQILGAGAFLCMLIPNLIFVRGSSLVWYFCLMTYLILMSLWFFQRKLIQPNLILALITHNPCMMLLNYYLLSLTTARYGLEIFTFDFLCINLMLYLPATEFEISRKIRAPQRETEYVTYSKILGVAGAVRLLLCVSFVEVAATVYMSYRIFPKAFLFVFAGYYLIYCLNGCLYVRDPMDRRFEIGRFARGYIYVMQGTLVVVALLTILGVWR